MILNLFYSCCTGFRKSKYISRVIRESVIIWTNIKGCVYWKGLLYYLSIIGVMSHDISSSIRKYKRILVLAIAIAVISMYMIPFDELGALAKKASKNDPPGKDDGKGKKEKDNNCENGLPPHKNGKSYNGNHYGCLKHL